MTSGFSSRCFGLMPPGRCCQGEAGITCFVTQQDVLVTASWLHKMTFSGKWEVMCYTFLGPSIGRIFQTDSWLTGFLRLWKGSSMLLPLDFKITIEFTGSPNTQKQTFPQTTEKIGLVWPCGSFVIIPKLKNEEILKTLKFGKSVTTTRQNSSLEQILCHTKRN